ncbi:hypothetical protein CHUAL_000154 [Chamberlinius hualienensis]
MGESGSVVNLWYPDYEKVLSEGIWNLFERHYKTDLLIANGGRHLQVHQLVLAIFCPQFENYYNSTYQLNSVDLDEEDLHLLLQFIYRGTVSVCSEKLDKIRIGAQDLGLQALVDVIDCFRDHEKSKEESANSSNERSNKRKGIKPVKLNSKKGRKGGKKVAVEAKLLSTNVKMNEDETTVEAEDEEEDEAEVDDDVNDADYSGSIANSELEAEMNADETATNTQNGRKLRSGWKSGVSKSSKGENSGNGGRRGSKPKEYLKCPHCNYGTYQRGTFNYHLETHEAHREFVCEVCTKVFRNRRKYLGHVKAHKNPELVIQCSHCDYRTPTRSVLNQHMAARHHVDPQGNKLEMNLKCPQCDFLCVSQFQLKNHLYKHSSKPYKCGECEFSAVRQSMIERHHKIKHRDLRPYLCDNCGYRGKTLGAFKYHLLRHTGEKKFVCDVCGQAFALNWYLKQHQKVHSSDDKPFPCHLCSFATRKRYNLQVHLGHVHKLDPITVKAALNCNFNRNVGSGSSSSSCGGNSNGDGIVQQSINVNVVTTSNVELNPLLHELNHETVTLIETLPRLEDCGAQTLVHFTGHVQEQTITHMPQFIG